LLPAVVEAAVVGMPHETRDKAFTPQTLPQRGRLGGGVNGYVHGYLYRGPGTGPNGK